MNTPTTFTPTAVDLWNLSQEIECLLTHESVALRVWEASDGDVLLDLDRKTLRWVLGWLQQRIGDPEMHIALTDYGRAYAAALDVGLWLYDSSLLQLKKAPLGVFGNIGGRFGFLLSVIHTASHWISLEDTTEHTSREGL